MNFEIIDYSEEYYKVLLKEPIPAKRSGKFVQIRNNETDKEFIILSPSKFSIYHADIVEKFCLANGITGRHNRSSHYFKISHTSWEVIGGGHWVINSVNRTLDLTGKSQAYGRFDSNGVKENILSLLQMKGYTVKINSRGNGN